ncbi:FkbM family methyltransferase [Pedobacter jamesrossensis]|uniref:FkbM family methyltransferase n=1 Tax=Pedobacter jamesrossensis TaxID=1908238 RepID=A0ABV8NS42_9SPHI
MKFFKNLFNNYKKESIKYFKTSYAQDGEDVLLSSLFDDMGGRGKGFYIDIGAHHPFKYSNTAHFYEMGWRGINIEPMPNAIDLFEKYRKHDTNLNIGIGEKNDKLTFYCFDEPALNSFSKELSEERNNTTKYKIEETKEIFVYPLAEILDKHIEPGQHIDFMSVDVEGLDLQVLKSNNWDKYKPEFILAEDIIDFFDLKKSEVYNFLIDKNYKMVAKTQRTMIFKFNSI